MEKLLKPIQDLRFEAPLPGTLVTGIQEVPGTPLPDIEAQVCGTLAESGLLLAIQPGQSVATGFGSRGVSNIPETVRTLARTVPARSGDPFIFPAMSSHGGSTAAGQMETLAHLGVTQATVEAPVRGTMEFQPKVRIPDGPQLYQRLDSPPADHVILVNRVKSHTSSPAMWRVGFPR